MNIQQFYEERERSEQDKSAKEGVTNDGPVRNPGQEGSTVIPVVQEQATIHKEELETGKVRVHTKVVEVEKSIDVPLMKEGYDIERVPVDQLIDAHPQVRQEGDRIIIPVVQEVLVVQKRLKLVEEVHVIKRQTTVNRTENFTLRKEEVYVDRTPTDNKDKT